MASTRSKRDGIVASFATLEDPRSEINRRHPLPGVLVIAVLAVLAGAAGPTAIARWAKDKEGFLTGLLDLPRGIPGKDAFRRVLIPEHGHYARVIADVFFDHFLAIDFTRYSPELDGPVP